MRKPTTQYLEIAGQLATLIERGWQVGESQNDKKRLQATLRTAFMRGFGLEPDHLKKAWRLYYRFCNTPLAPRSLIFDHQEFFQRGDNLVIVSQPYGLDLIELKRWASDIGASYTIADEWAYYYPGKAGLFLVDFTPQAKAALDKRLRRHEWRRPTEARRAA